MREAAKSVAVLAQAELAQAKAQLKEAAHAAASAAERADELEWRLKQQEAALAERLRLVGEAKQATEDLSEVLEVVPSLRAVQMEASCRLHALAL